jgi:putative Holliday junction resolvase
VSGRILGIDLGEKRIGLALAEEGGLSARPLATIPRGQDISADARALTRIIEEQGIDAVVVGLPLEAGGNEGTMAIAARAWGSALAVELGVPVSYRDERLSSHVAESRLGPMPRGRSGGPPSRTQRARYRERVDREAAAIILQDELEARRSGETPVRSAARPEESSSRVDGGR